MIGEIVEIKQGGCHSDNQAFWRKTNDFVDGDPQNICSGAYIQPYDTEVEGNTARPIFGRRLARSYPLYLSSAILAEYVSLCNQNVTPEGFDLEPLLNDITGYGVKLSEFVKTVTREMLKNGQFAILAEGTPANAPTKAQAKASGERSFVALYPAPAILRAERFASGLRMGQISDVILLEKPEFVDGKEIRRARRYFYPENATAYVWQKLREESSKNATTAEIQFKVIEENEGAVSSIPVAIGGRGPDDSALRLVIQLDIATVNKLSTYSNTNYFQAFQRIFLFKIKNAEAVKAVAENRFAVTNDDGNMQQIEPVQLVSLEREIDTLLHWTKRLGMRQFRQLIDDMTKQVSSAESKKKDNEALAAYCDEILDVVESRVEEALRFLAEYEGAQPDSVDVTIAREFAITDSAEDDAKIAMIWQRAQNAGAAGVAIRKAILRKDIAALELDEEEEAKLLDLLEKENIESMNPTIPAQRPRITLADSLNAAANNTSGN